MIEGQRVLTRNLIRNRRGQYLNTASVAVVCKVDGDNLIIETHSACWLKSGFADCKVSDVEELGNGSDR